MAILLASEMQYLHEVYTPLPLISMTGHDTWRSSSTNIAPNCTRNSCHITATNSVFLLVVYLACLQFSNQLTGIFQNTSHFSLVLSIIIQIDHVTSDVCHKDFRCRNISDISNIYEFWFRIQIPLLCILFNNISNQIHRKSTTQFQIKG